MSAWLLLGTEFTNHWAIADSRAAHAQAEHIPITFHWSDAQEETVPKYVEQALKLQVLKPAGQEAAHGS